MKSTTASTWTHNPSDSDGSIRKTSSIKVFTPHRELKDNSYLTCLWSAVEAYGVEINALKLTQLAAQPLFEKQRVDSIIHLHWVQKFCPFAADRTLQALFASLKYLSGFGLLRLRGYKLVWTVHNTLSHDSKAPQFEYGFRWLLSRFSTDIITMSEYGRQEFVDMFGRKTQVHVIPHGNYIGAYPNQITAAEARQILGIPLERKVFLHLGQLKPYKGINYLLEAFAQVKQPEVVLLIAGSCCDTEMTETIQQAAQADSRIYPKLEFIPDDDIQLYMNACDWVVLPYQRVLNSGSALLSLSFSRPVIVPQRGALTELIKDSEQGICYADDRDLADAMKRAIATPPEQWQQMCSDAYKRAQQFDWSHIGAMLYQVYQQRH